MGRKVGLKMMQVKGVMSCEYEDSPQTSTGKAVRLFRKLCHN